MQNAKCGVNAKETASCDNGCGTTDTKEVENSALEHDIVIDEAVAPKCKETGLTAGQHCSRCDDMTVAQKVLPALGHVDKDGDYVCDNGCGYEFEKPVTPDEPTVSVEDCDCLCHSDGFFGAIFSFLVKLFSRIFGVNRICECGMPH